MWARSPQKGLDQSPRPDPAALPGSAVLSLNILEEHRGPLGSRPSGLGFLSLFPGALLCPAWGEASPEKGGSQPPGEPHQALGAEQLPGNEGRGRVPAGGKGAPRGRAGSGTLALGCGEGRQPLGPCPS